MDPMPDLESVALVSIRLEAEKGAQLTDCLNESAVVALRMGAPVVLIFNDLVYGLCPEKIRGTAELVGVGGQHP